MSSLSHSVNSSLPSSPRERLLADVGWTLSVTVADLVSTGPVCRCPLVSPVSLDSDTLLTLALAWVTRWGKPGTLPLPLLVRGLRDLLLVTGDKVGTPGAGAGGLLARCEGRVCSGPLSTLDWPGDCRGRAGAAWSLSSDTSL